MGNGQTKEEKIIEETATKETYLECPVLVDLDHGTVRHRHEERIKDENDNDDNTKKIKVGYFYHPKLNDFSEDAVMSHAEKSRLKYVFEGPPKDRGKRLYYIYGTSTSDRDKGIRHEEYKPQGKGYNWPQSYRLANNLYYDVIFLEDEVEGELDNLKSTDVFGEESTSVSSGIVSIASSQQKDNIRLKLRLTETVSNVIERVSLQLLIPETNIHLLWNKNELNKNDLIADLVSQEKKRPYLTIQLRLT